MGARIDRSSGDEPQLVEFDRAVAERSADLPNLVPLADPAARPDADSHFAFALDCLIAGLAARLRAEANSGRSARLHGHVETRRAPRELDPVGRRVGRHDVDVAGRRRRRLGPEVRIPFPVCGLMIR